MTLPDDPLGPFPLRSGQDRRAGFRPAVPSYAWLGAAITIVIQIVALVWGAAKMASSVEQLSATVADGRAALRELNQRTSEIQLQVTELRTQFQDRNQWMTNPPAWYTQPPPRKP